MVTPIRFVALGDSITAGIGDPVGGSWRGWAALLAESLGAELYNLAELGAQSHTLTTRQLPVALSLLQGRSPAVAALVVGVNDTLRGSFHIGRTGRALAAATEALRATGAQVLTCSLPDPGRMLRLPKSLARQLARRMRAVNSVTAELAALYDTVHFDAGSGDDLYDRRMWSVDRLHPSEAGHRLLARVFADELARRGIAVPQPPSMVPTSPPPSRAASVAWMATRGTKWVVNRSTDLVPSLLGMCAKEWWHTRRGRANLIEVRLANELDDTLKALREDQSPRLPTPA
jgi:lysophospholipase L1-like esterase